MIKLDNTKRFYDEIKTMGFFQRLFSWGKIIPLLTESYSEISKIEEIADIQGIGMAGGWRWRDFQIIGPFGFFMLFVILGILTTCIC